MTPHPPSERSKRHLNMLASIAVCIGLMIAYYLSVGQGRIAPDTHVIFRHIDCQTRCSGYQIDILADGTTYYQGANVPGLNGVYRYKLTKFALRRLLRTFARVRFFELDAAVQAPPISASPISTAPNSTPQCLLTLVSGHQKMALRHICGAPSAAVARPTAAINLATHMTTLAARRNPVPGLYLQPAALPAGAIVRPLVFNQIP